MEGGERGGVHRGEVGGGVQRADDLPLDGLARHLHDDGASGLVVEGQDVDARQRLGGEEAEGRHAQLVGECLPGGGHEADELLALGEAPGDKAAGLRGHQCLGRLVDAQHFSLQWDRARSLSAARRGN
jgi:hypothetical protein